MKYLIIQSTASALLIRIYIISKERKEISKVFFLIIAIRLLIKIAAAPFYQWLIKITKGISWSQNIILLTWQKLAPVYLLIFQSSRIFVIAVPLSALLGAVLILNKTHVKEIFGLSSLFNLRWIIISIIFRIKIYLIFFLIYSVVNATALIVFWKRNQENLTEKKSKYDKERDYSCVNGKTSRNSPPSRIHNEMNGTRENSPKQNKNYTGISSNRKIYQSLYLSTNY